MPQALNDLGGLFGSGGTAATTPGFNGTIPGIGGSSLPEWMKLLGVGSGISGIIGNILGGNLRNQALTQQLSVQKNLMNMSPQALSTLISQMTQPLSAGLTQGVTNKVQADLAERGLSQAPGIFASEESQALAPFQMQEQQLGLQAALQKLGLPIEAAARFLPTPQQGDTSGIWRMLMGLGKVTGGDPTGGNNFPINLPLGPANAGSLPMIDPGYDNTAGNNQGSFDWSQFGGLVNPA